MWRFCSLLFCGFFVAFSWPSSVSKNSVRAFFVTFSWLFRGPRFGQILRVLATEYDRANVPPYNGNDAPPAPGSLKRFLFPTLLNEVQNKGTQGVRARYGAELPPIISIVRYPGRPVISVPDFSRRYPKGDGRKGTGQKMS